MIQLFLIILEQVCLYVPLIVGGYISFSLLKVPDLSIECAYVFGAILASKMAVFTQDLNSFFYMLLVVFSGLIGGMIVGLISSTLTKFAKLPHLLSSILTIGIFHGISQAVLGVPTFSISHLQNALVALDLFIQNPELPVIFIACLFVVLFGYFFLKTQLGVSLVVYGNNPEFFQHHGISNKFVFVCGITISNGLAGLSGYFVSQLSGFVDVNSGFGMVLFCITSLILGKTVFAKINEFYSIFIPVVGVVLYCFLQQFLLKIGFNLKYFTMIQSIIVMLVLINKYRKISSVDVKDSLGV